MWVVTTRTRKNYSQTDLSPMRKSVKRKRSKAVWKEPWVVMFLENALQPSVVTKLHGLTYLHNKSLQLFSHDYGPSFLQNLCCVRVNFIHKCRHLLFMAILFTHCVSAVV